MLFLSRGKSPTVLMVPGFEEIVQTTHGNIPRVKKPVWLKFTPASVPFEAPGLPAKWKTGKAFGYLDSQHVARQAGVTEEQVIDFLTSHPDHGVEFIGVMQDGEELKSGEDAVFVPEGEKGFFCKVCEKHLASVQGVTGHKMSAEHQTKMEERSRQLRETMNSAV